jgi:hypothetical protein
MTTEMNDTFEFVVEPDPILGVPYAPQWAQRKRMKWGTTEEHMNIFTETPFGVVELLDFYKEAGSGEFLVKFEVLSDEHIPTGAIVLWQNCPSHLATKLFGISVYEQSMWGNL